MEIHKQEKRQKRNKGIQYRRGRVEGSFQGIIRRYRERRSRRLEKGDKMDGRSRKD